MRPWPLLLLLFLAAAVEVRADLVVLQDGGQVEGEVTDLGDRLQVRMRSGTVTLSRADVREVVRRPLPAQAFRDRRAALSATDVPGRLSLAQFCFDHEMYEEYGTLLREVLRLAPANEMAQRGLYQYRKLHEPLPRSRSAENKLRFELGDGWTLVYGDHMLVCTNGDRGFAEERLRQLEAHYRHFYRYFEERGFELGLLERRLEAVIFRSQDEYAAFARKNAPGLEAGAGYYSASTNRLYFFDARNSRRREEAQSSIQRMEQRLRTLRAELQDAYSKRDRRRAEAVYAEYDDLFERCSRTKWQWREFFDQANVATTLHEATHQLCHNSGLLRASVPHPTWLAEGLALFFEDAEQWYTAGSRVNLIDRDRIADLQEALRKDRLIPLGSLLGLDRSFFSLGERRVHLAYAQSWALVRFFIKGSSLDLRKRFFKYLRQRSMIQSTAPASEDRRVGELLEALAMDLGQLEREWRTFVRSLPPPE